MVRELAIGEKLEGRGWDWVRIDEETGEVEIANSDELTGYNMNEYFGFGGEYRGKDCYGIGIGVWEEESLLSRF